jgi:Protein of unknown function (DUF2778)
MSVPAWERGAFLGGVLGLLLAVAPHAYESARNETSVAKTEPGQVQNLSIHHKTLRAAEATLFAAVSSEAPPAKSGGSMQEQLVSTAVTAGIQPQMLAAVPRSAKWDDEAGGASPSVEDLQRKAGVAIYDIERGKVYLPDGEMLEAHSGIGRMRDNPAFVSRRNSGPTPPDMYNLSLRESRFLGVEAIRLTPAGGDAAVFGRVGFLAHTYMLRRPGDSNGCIVFKEYHRFLAAFKKGQIKQLVVVPRLKEAPASILTALLPAKNS